MGLRTMSLLLPEPKQVLTVRLPAPPSLRQVLQDRLCFILLDRLRHHVENVMHDRSTQFKVIVRFHTLLRHRLCDTLAVTAFELTGKQVTEPTI
jgi:hypothetical protein